MSDLTDINAAQSVKIVGSDAAGVEETPVQSTTNGGLHTNLRNNAGTEVATSSNPLRTDPTGTTTQPVSAASLPLPTGAATESTLSTLNAKIPASPAQEHTTAGSPSSVRLTDGTTFYKGTTPADTQPISAVALPLPSGASTLVAQTTGNASLSSIDGKVPALGQAVAAASVPVVLTAAQLITLTPPSSVSVSNFPATQPVSAASLPLPSGAATSANQTTANSSLSSIDTKTPALGQAAMAASTPVVIASNQSTLPISAASLPLPSGASTEATLSTLNTKIPSGLTIVSNKLEVESQDIVNSSGVYGTLVVGTSAVQLKVGASNLTGRKSATMDNTSTATLYWGYDSSITTSAYAGRIFPDQQAAWSVGAGVSIFLIAATPANNAHISEGA